MKVFKLAKSEFKKIMFKPIIILAFLAVIASIVISTFTFDPIAKQRTTVILGGTNVIAAYNVFIGETNDNCKSNLDKKLQAQKDWFVEYTTRIKNEEELTTLKTHITKTDSDLQQLRQQIPKYYSTPKDATLEEILTLYNNLHNSSTTTYNYLSGLENDLSFYITLSDFEQLTDYYKKISTNIPYDFANPDLQFKQVNDYLQENCNSASITPIVSNLKSLNLNEETINDLLDKYYYSISSSNTLDQDTLLDNLFNQIKTFAQENASSARDEDFIKLNNLISNYKSIVNMSSTALKYGLTIETAGDKSDKELQNYIGFSNYNSYLYKQTFATNEYLLQNGKFDYNYLSPFSFNVNSGETTNAFDFVVYSMQILTFVIAIFLIFVAGGTIASELSNGTMKMLAIRPYNRTKIIFGKFLSCLALMLLLLLIGFAISFLVGIISYGIKTLNVLVVFNGTNVAVLNAFVMMLIYFVSCALNLTVFISFVLFISVLFKSNVISVIFGILLYGFNIISNALLYNKLWYTYTPFAHLDLYKYMGASANTGQFFGFSLGIGSSFLMSIIYLLAILLLTIIASTLIFRKRNIT